MFTFKALSSITILGILLPVVSPASPPSSVTIIHPSSSRTSGIGNGTLLPFGIADAHDDSNNTYWGLWRRVNISLTYPNGTEPPVLGVGTLDTDNTEGQCRIFPGVNYTSKVRADQDGRYTAHWNITYGITTNSSEIVPDESCGPGPLSLQNFTIDYSFDVALSGDDESEEVPQETAVRELGAEPTGSVNPNPTNIGTSAEGGQPTQGPGDSGGNGNGGPSAYGCRVGVATIVLCVVAGVLTIIF